METNGEEKNMKLFVTFEGIDGSGKSTIMQQVYSYFNKNKQKVIKTFEPTDTPIGHLVQECIKTHTDPFVTALTFSADRIQHGKQIQRWLDEGTIVLCDRYEDSTYAYQGVQLESLIHEPVTWLQQLTIDQIPHPDCVFVFLLDPEIAIQRIQNREELIPFEKVEFLTKVQKIYEQLSTGPYYQIVDATQPIDDIVKFCINHIIDS